MCRFGASGHFQPCQAVGGLDSDMFASSLLRFCRLIRLVRVVHPGGILRNSGRRDQIGRDVSGVKDPW